jgi:MYXO-CTERM domain-containing protein
MKKLIITAAALMVAAAAAYGQGQFLFNTHDTSATPPNNVQFTFNGQPATGSDLFVQVLAGKDAASLAPVTGTLGSNLPLNRPAGKGAGYTNPFSDIYTVPGMAGGSSATVGYVAYQGSSYATAVNKSALTLATSPIALTEPPTPPSEVALGTQTVSIVPEPATWALGLLGLGSLLAIRRRK